MGLHQPPRPRLRALEHWAHLADQILNDAVYRDRIEWESAENALSGNRSNAGGVSELLAISDSFGWDNDDKVGWSKVNFELLGTSKGGRIPRRRNESESEAGEESEREKKGSEGLGEKRRERRERRVRMQREEGLVGKEEEKVGGSFGDGVGSERRSRKENGEEDNWVVDNSKKLAGREFLLRKAYRRFL